MTKDVLIVAFDGLDYDLVEQFNLENIPQKEFGKIDNQTDIEEVKTYELFASFITGETVEEHGIKGTRYNYPDNWKTKLLHNPLMDKFPEIRGGVTLYQAIRKQLLKYHQDLEVWNKDHIQVETIFDKIEHSRAINIPSYDPPNYTKTNADNECLRRGYSYDKLIEMWDELEHPRRKRVLFSELESIGARPFLMAHFHRPDVHQHGYGDKYLNNNFDREYLLKLYNETDKLAGEIKSAAEDAGYDTVIFMSDHGLPTKKEHNENAFYSCNEELFLGQTPHITDFHDKILELVSDS